MHPVDKRVPWRFCDEIRRRVAAAGSFSEPARVRRVRRPSNADARTRSGCREIRARASRRSGGRPRPRRCVRAASMSATRYATWCRPGPRDAKNRPTGVSGPRAPSSWMNEDPVANNTSSTPWSTTRSRWTGSTPSSRAYSATDASRSSTAIPTWSMSVSVIVTRGSPRSGCIRATKVVRLRDVVGRQGQRARHRRDAQGPQVGLRAWRPAREGSSST